MTDAQIVNSVEAATLVQSDVIRLVSPGERGEKKVALRVAQILPPVIYCVVNEHETSPRGPVTKESTMIARLAVDSCLQAQEGTLTLEMADARLYDYRKGFGAIPDDAWGSTPVPCERIELFQ
jgi:hypothetical protein